MAETIEVLVDGGKASAGPPLGPALGPTGINIMNVVNEINTKTKDFAGMKVPVVVTIDPKKKTFEVEVGTPPATALIMDILKLEKGSQTPGTEIAGDVKLEHLMKVVRMKGDSLAGKNIMKRVKEVAGTCVSIGVTIEGRKPVEFQKELEQGVYDDQMAKA